MKIKLLYIFLGFFISFCPVKAIQFVKGIVFEDKNQDGIRQKNEKLLRNILISDGDTIVKTNKYGFYQIQVSNGSCVFPVLPGNYSFSNAKKIVTNSYFNIGDDNSELILYDFALKEINNPKDFRVDVVGDVQVDDEEQLYFAEQTILSELLQNGDKEFALFMGDLSNDNDTLLAKMHSLIGHLPFNSYSVMGNHDFDTNKPRTSKLFKKLFGTDVYAFFKGDVCFVILNDNDGFKGYISPNQIRFLKQIIKNLPKKNLLVVSQHVPLIAVSNRDEFLNAIGDQPCLILSGHTHNVHRYFWTSTINEWGVGASCGSWWQGEKDQNGIPLALQQYGSPRNYYKLFINGNKYQLKFKGIGLDNDHQMDIKIKGQDVFEDSIPSLSELDNGCVIANIYSGGDSTKVEISLDNGAWFPMNHTLMVAPSVSRIIELNKRKIYSTHFSTKIPLRSQHSPHIWAYQLPINDTDYHILKIRAYDNFGLGEIQQSLIFNLTRK